MEEEFVPYAEALALKELGFDETCIGFYNIKGISVSDYKVTKLQIDSLGLEKCCLAPLYQQCFRWFREKYILQCFPMQESIDVWWCLFSKDVLSSGYLLKDGDYGHYSDEHLEFKTYEEAQLECLKKLIEIVKEKNQ